MVENVVLPTPKCNHMLTFICYVVFSGIPFGSVNLLHGVDKHESKVISSPALSFMLDNVGLCFLVNDLVKWLKLCQMMYGKQVGSLF